MPTQHYQKIRRASAAAASASSSPVKLTTPKSTPTKNKKRKLSAATISTADDDSEPDPDSGCKVKGEQEDLFKGSLFKIEEEAGEGGVKKPIDLERSDE
ncbi:hypothetical protein GP486_007970 [Trichoglossum hirsutum]|uniref:Uncharacterized protein n=1 Tax=Trichoglossum hirsutum TaxID=265104 RepID=A0A9P8IAR5_9PEZI|nr:hypothetical protein GP486_007970 [Trichoglossum hirsutum]